MFGFSIDVEPRARSFSICPSALRASLCVCRFSISDRTEIVALSEIIVSAFTLEDFNASGICSGQ